MKETVRHLVLTWNEAEEQNMVDIHSCLNPLQTAGQEKECATNLSFL